MAKEKERIVIPISKRVSEGRQILWQTLHKDEVIDEGDYVKVGFSFKHPDTGKEFSEHMWLLITKVVGSKLTGTLSSDPQMVKAFKYGDEVVVNFSQIEEHIKGKNRNT